MDALPQKTGLSFLQQTLRETSGAVNILPRHTSGIDGSAHRLWRFCHGYRTTRGHMHPVCMMCMMCGPRTCGRAAWQGPARRKSQWRDPGFAYLV